MTKQAESSPLPPVGPFSDIANDATAYYNKGNDLFASNCHPAALQAYEQAIRLNPQYVDAYKGMGNALLKLERDDEAREAFEYSSISPTNPISKQLIVNINIYF